jgi:predicted metal-dependent hydrolase
MMRDKRIINEKEYTVFILQEKRNDSRVSIGKKGVHIRLPLQLQRGEVFKETIRLKRWATEQLEKNPPKYRRKGLKFYNDGDTLKVGNDHYLIRIYHRANQGSSAKAVDNTLHLTISNRLSDELKQKHVSVLLSRLMAQKKKPFIKEKIHDLNEKHFNFDVGEIFLKYNTTNWGSCSNSSNINISTRLLFAPDSVINYVCIHELAHLQEKNHSPAFWNLVKKAMPDYKDKQEWLKKNSDVCWF